MKNKIVWFPVNPHNIEIYYIMDFKRITKTNVTLQFVDDRDNPMFAKVFLKGTIWGKLVNKNIMVDHFICKQRGKR